MNTNIEDTVISNGIKEFERFKALASEAIERCKSAEQEAQFYKGQNELLEQQKKADEARHRTDLLRIAELEAFIATVLEQYHKAEERLRLGAFRRPNSIPQIAGDLDAEIRRLANQSVGATSASDRIARVSDQNGG